MHCGLLGRKLGHSYSPQIHAFLGNYSYELFEKKPEEIGRFLRDGDFAGINVTIPYKKAVIEYLDELSPIAARLGAVNTIVRRNGKLIGHNTDYFGFLTMVQASGLTVTGKKVLVLGSGGASNTAAAVLDELGANVVVVSRTGENHYGNIHIHADARLIVNATPVGMYPKNGASPVDLNVFPDLEGVLDLIYNPARTRLLLDAEKRGIVAMNGLLMLVTQAKEAAEWFTGSKIDCSKIREINQALATQMQNLILIGMPGCGKSTIGSLLAQQTRRTYVDADVEIVRKAGKTIPQIFADEGEEAFRTIETAVLEELGQGSGLVIATGGGCVTQPRNYPLLHQNGWIFWVQREIGQLPKDGRPLSQKNDLNTMYQIRKPLYASFADHVIDNNKDVSDAITQILEVLS